MAFTEQHFFICCSDLVTSRIEKVNYVAHLIALLMNNGGVDASCSNTLDMCIKRRETVTQLFPQQ